MSFVWDPSKVKKIKVPTKVLVKVQQSITTGFPKRQVLVYNRDHTVFYQGDVTPHLAERLKDELKSYWFATLMPSGTLELNCKAGWRNW